MAMESEEQSAPFMIAQVRQCCLRWIKLYVFWTAVILPFFLHIPGQNPVTLEDGGMFL
jgi:hypothetical protein